VETFRSVKGVAVQAWQVAQFRLQERRRGPAVLTRCRAADDSAEGKRSNGPGPAGEAFARRPRVNLPTFAGDADAPSSRLGGFGGMAVPAGFARACRAPGGKDSRRFREADRRPSVLFRNNESAMGCGAGGARTVE